VRLLVSVRSPAEVEAALAGGADIIDAKEPNRGSLGAVSPADLLEILNQVPETHGVSAALGDIADVGSVEGTFAALPQVVRAAPLYVKLGFAGVSEPEHIEVLLQAARAAAQGCLAPPRIIAVAYADHRLAASAAPEAVFRAAALAGVTGVLLDTQSKGNGTLLDWIDSARLLSLLQEARRSGLLTAVAGSLEAHQIETVRWAEPDIVGFRGAVCVGGREGRVSLARVQHIRRALAQVHASDFVQ
jgi:(5-formylfuran-3-yl)methyl phosphate synthase